MDSNMEDKVDTGVLLLMVCFGLWDVLVWFTRQVVALRAWDVGVAVQGFRTQGLLTTIPQPATHTTYVDAKLPVSPVD